jgi:hypothetical protein
MTSVRKYAYAAVLAMTGFNLLPSLASAQDAHGRFTLNHEVHWQNAVVPAGTYRFAVGSKGPAEMLMLTRAGSPKAGFIILVNPPEEANFAGTSQLVLVARAGESFVSAMELPEYGIVLRFPVPAEPREVAHAAATPTVFAAQ